MTKRGTGGGGGFATERRRYPQGFGLYHIRLCGQNLQHSTAQHGNRLMGFVFPPLGRMSMVQEHQTNRSTSQGSRGNRPVKLIRTEERKNPQELLINSP